MSEPSISPDMIQRAAAAIANARGMRRGAPAITNILAILPDKLKAEVLEDAEEALKAGLAGSIFDRFLNAEQRAAKLAGELDVVNEAFEAAASRLASEHARSADLARALDLALDGDRQADIATAVAIRAHWSRSEPTT